MSTARFEILGRMKAVLKSSPRQIEPVLIPKRGQATGPARIEMFVAEAVYGLAEVVRLSNVSEVPGEVVKLMTAAATQHVKAAPHQALQDLDWGHVNVNFGRCEALDGMSLSVAYGAVAETGTLVMRSGVDAPTTLNFLPDVHVVVVFSTTIEANYEAVWQRLHADNIQLPRTVNWITGPSRTADIEQTMLLGAHGPRKLVILLVDEKT